MKLQWGRIFVWGNALRVIGVLGIAYEATRGQSDPALLVLFGSMIGLPEVLKHDQQQHEQQQQPEQTRNGGAK